MRDALAELPYEIVAAVLVGGIEKLKGGESYGVPLAASLEAAVAEYGPELVLDLSDEPVLGPRERFRMIARALALGVPYEGADFRFDPPHFEPVAVPSLAVVGTGKRVGKTAVTGHVARTLAVDRRVVVVAMGRGGPAEPETVTVPPTVEGLLALSRAGRHAASDHLETAALARVPTVGCRRCGGGLAGAVGLSNVLAGVRAAERLQPDLLVLDGSGAALPPVASARRVLVVGGHQDPAVATGYLNAYRALLADLVVIAMAEDDVDHAALGATCRRSCGPACRSYAPCCGLTPRGTCAAAGSRSSAPRRRPSTAASPRTCATSTAQTSPTSPAASPTAPRCAPSSGASTPRRSSWS